MKHPLESTSNCNAGILQKALNLLNKAEEIFAGSAILLTTVILFLNVILRYIFKESISWAEEVIKYLMIWIAFIAGSICVRKGAHVSIDFFLDYLSVKMRKGLTSLVYLISISFAGLMVHYGIKVIDFLARTGQVSPALQIPMWIPYLAIPIGFALMTFRWIIELVKVWIEP